MVATSCDLNAPRCTTKAQQVRAPGSRGAVFVDHRPPGTPVIPCCKKNIIYKDEPAAKFYVYSDVTHTHTPWFACNEVEVKMKRGVKMRWKWKWNIFFYLTGTRGGERKRRGREQTPTPTHLARSGQTLKGQEKRKTEADGQEKKPAVRGGRTEASEPTYHSETYAYLGTHRTQPIWGRKNAWNRGPNGELIGEEEWRNKVKWDSVQG